MRSGLWLRHDRCTPPESLSLLGALLPDKGVTLVAQSGGSLSERMFDAVARPFEEDLESVLILGTGAPTLPSGSIFRATHALDGRCNVAIVGSTDGGYVLLGMREPYEELFCDVRWSTRTVYRETLTRAHSLGLSVNEGEPRYNVDTPEDLSRLARELAVRPDHARTRRKF